MINILKIYLLQFFFKKKKGFLSIEEKVEIIDKLSIIYLEIIY
jgi:hypothetical protein